MFFKYKYKTLIFSADSSTSLAKNRFSYVQSVHFLILKFTKYCYCDLGERSLRIQANPVWMFRFRLTLESNI